MAGFPVQGIFVFPEHPSNSYSMRTPWAFWLLIFVFTPNIIRSQSIFSETFNEVNQNFGDDDGVTWTCSSFCNGSSGTFESTGSFLLVHNPKQEVFWITSNMDVSGWDEVQLVINFQVQGDIESPCQIGANCECTAQMNLSSGDCPSYPTNDFINFGYRLNGAYTQIPDQLGCGSISCTPPPNGCTGSCDVGAGSYTYYGDCLAGSPDDNDMNNGTNSASFNLPYTINVTGINNLSLEFSFQNSSSSEYFRIIQVNVNGTVMPVEWLSFNANLIGKQTELRWETAQEFNSAYFEVQRSNNGSRFEAIGLVDAAGFTTEKQSYTFTDTKPLPGTNYYRLAQTDLDGSFEYSPIRSVELDGRSMLVYPNPTSNELNLGISGFDDPAGDWVIIDMTGRICMEGNYTNQAISIASLPAGMYICRFTDGQFTLQQPFRKQ